jgi:Bifunctional DNA primase/polymerase, N-terminal/Protein of unknown function (DUF3987)/Primase C terminal 1 (PriCT-1)
VIQTSFKEIALPLAAMGIPVGRLQHKSKKPMDLAWPTLATTDMDKILAWGAETPGAGCMSVAKDDGVCFLETDFPGVVELIQKETGIDLKTNFHVQTRPNEERYHFYFLNTDQSRGCGSISQKSIPHIGSFRQNNAYVVSPGSVHEKTGLPYTLINDVPLTPIPTKLIEWLQSQRTKAEPTAAAASGDGPIPDGSRDDVLTSIAGSLREKGMNYDEIYPVVSRQNQERCKPPKDDADIKRICKSVCRYPAGNPGPTTLIAGRLPGQNVAQSHAHANAAQAQPTVEVITAEGLAEMQKKVTAPKGIVEYPYAVWEGTIFQDFADLCGEGNVIPKEFFIESVKTVVGAICGHRIYPFQTASQESRFYTVLMGPGGSGKSSAVKWARDLFIGTGLLYELSQTGAFMNIGTAQGSFASASGLVKNGFSKHASILQVYDEFTTLIEKFAIPGSGGAFLDAMNQLFESGTMQPLHTKEKSDNVITTLVHNSILAATTPRRWDSAFTKTSAEGSGFFQRLNFVANPSEDRVATLRDPNFTVLTDRFLRKIQPLEYQTVVVHMRPEANEMLNDWYNKKKTEWRGVSEDITGRIQVMVHRNASLLSWLAAGDHLPDAENANVPIDVTCDEDIIERAIKLAEYEVFVRKMYRPVEVNNDYARMESAIRRNFVQTGGAPISRNQLRQAVNGDRFGIKMFNDAIVNLLAEGFIRIGQMEGETKRGRKSQLIMLVED